MKNSKFLKLVPLQFFQKPFKRNEETEGNEIYYTPFTWRDFSECCKFLQMILNEETSTTLKTLENQQKHLLELFYFGCNSIFLNSDIYFQVKLLFFFFLFLN